MGKRKKANKNNPKRRKETTSKNINEVLNDDCLLLIFDWLTVKDRVRLAPVCRKWKELSSKSWAKVKILNQHQSIPQSVSHDCFVKIIEKCGNNLTTLDLDGFDQIGPSFVIYLTSQKYPNLQSLHFGETLITCECPVLSDSNEIKIYCGICLNKIQKALQLLKTWSVSKQLKKIGIPFRLSAEQAEQQLYKIGSLLPKFEKLELLELDLEYDDNRCKKIVFDKIPLNTLKDVIFLNCNFMKNNATIVTALSRINQLRKVAFQIFPRCEILEALIPHAETLDTLALDFSKSPSPTTHRPILKLVNLRKLYLHNDEVLDNKFLSELVQHCEKLTLFSFSAPIMRSGHHEDDYLVIERLTDSGISHLSRLQDLQYLFLHHSRTMTGTFLSNLKNLKVLSCRFAYDVEEKYLSTVVRHSPELRILDIATMPRQFPKKFLETILEVTSERKNEIILNFTDSFRQTLNVCEVNELPKFLRIVDRIELPYSFRGGDNFPMLYESI